MNPSDFVHLHVHSEYSLLSATCRIEELIQRVKEMGQTAIALTDYGNLYSAVSFYDTARKMGIKPIIGCECYLAKDSRHHKDPNIDSENYQVVLLCENYEGYQNLARLVTLSNQEGFFNVPRIDSELLRKYHKGLICLSSGINGEIEQQLLSGNYQGAKIAVLRYVNIFGRESFFLELQIHSSPDWKLFNTLCRLAKETGIQTVATNNVHYVQREDVNLLKIQHCIRNNQTIDKLKQSDLFSGEWYLKTTEEMERIFSSIPEAISNTKIIANRCAESFPFGGIRLPRFVRNGITDNNSYFRQLCYEGMKKRYGEFPAKEITERLEHEMKVINAMGFVDYFLIVSDFIRYARSQDIPVGPGRGSGAGSLCAYCMGITQIDPIERQLIFERFLNPERKNMPDFDLDFCAEGRQKVKDYVINRYGSEHVAEIIAFDTLKPKSAVRDIGRALNIPEEIRHEIIAIVSEYHDIQTAVNSNEKLQKYYQGGGNVQYLLDMAVKSQGIVKNTSIHAAGVVIAPMVLSEYVPLRFKQKDDTPVTEYTMNDLDRMGLLKIDFLGLKNLTYIRDTERSVQKHHPDFSVDRIPLDDMEVYQMIASGDTTGVFQLESAGMRGFLMRLKPQNMEDIIAALALYRPGPMDAISTYIHNRKSGNITYPHPMLKDILSTTYGCIIYQEQVMQIFQKMAGYSLGQADIVRRNMSKKKVEAMEQERQIFLYGSGKNDNCTGAIAKGVPMETANHIFDMMANFALYAFNKSHAAAYALLSYQTAYLKYHYCGEFMASLMTSIMHSSTKMTALSAYMEECRKAGIRMNPPDINQSEYKFIFKDGVIYFGLSAIKGMDDICSDKILAERKKNGIFTSFADFCERIFKMNPSQKSIKNLIQVGALDNLDCNRRQMLENYERFFRKMKFSSRETEGQMSLFGDAETIEDETPEIPPMENYNRSQLLEMEKELLGVYVSGHPLDSMEWLRELLKCQPLANLQRATTQNAVKILVMVEEVRAVKTKKGDEMAFLKVKDKSGTMDAVIFASQYSQNLEKLKKGNNLYIKGKLSQRGNNSFICEEIHEAKEFPILFRNMQLCIKIESIDSNMHQQLQKMGNDCKGETELILYRMTDRKYIQCNPRIFVNISQTTYEKLQQVFRPEKMGLISAISRKI